jgi:NAD(P)-dependent dehydrogenase (short-subunit alcohol dehydrogenase family)
MEDLKDRIAVVTGAASGIGRGIARALAAKGCHVVVADVDTAGVEQLAAELASRGVRSLAARCDVTDPAALRALAAKLAELRAEYELAVAARAQADVATPAPLDADVQEHLRELGYVD